MVGCHASDSSPWVLSTMVLITGVGRLFIIRHDLHAMMCDISLGVIEWSSKRHFGIVRPV